MSTGLILPLDTKFACTIRKKEAFAVKHRKSGEDVVVEYGHFGIAILAYYTPVHSLAIQGHRICENSIRRAVDEREMTYSCRFRRGR